MQKPLFIAVLVLALSATACATCPPCAALATAPCPTCEDCSVSAKPQGPRIWRVTKVKDGDTLVVRQEDPERIETVRLLRINTPEKNERGYEEAKEALKYLVRGAEVTLEFENEGPEKRDGFGRLLAYLHADGLNVNFELVRQGWSAFYKKYGKGRMAAEFEAAEAEARAAKVGLWAAELSYPAAPPVLP